MTKKYDLNQPLGKEIKLKTSTGTIIYLQPDGAWFRFAKENTMRLVTTPDEDNYPYSHGSAEYREAIETINRWKLVNGWGYTT